MILHTNPDQIWGKFQTEISILSLSNMQTAIWQYGLWSFQAGVRKLEILLHKNQHTQRKLLKF